MQTELKKLAELNPELKDAYLAKQRRLKVSKKNNKKNFEIIFFPKIAAHHKSFLAALKVSSLDSFVVFKPPKNICFLQSKLFDHDNMKHLKKLLDELENVMDQVETELQRRVEETPGTESSFSEAEAVRLMQLQITISNSEINTWSSPPSNGNTV